MGFHFIVIGVAITISMVGGRYQYIRCEIGLVVMLVRVLDLRALRIDGHKQEKS